MTRQTTHHADENGIMRQIVTPAILRQILDQDGSDYARPDSFGPDDEWNIGDAERAA
jgi:hypothetical protein